MIFVSVLMPIRNEGKFIEISLRAVLTQEYPPGCLEVLIADGLSTDETRSVIARTAAQFPAIPVTVLDNPAGIVPTGLNLALKRAKGQVIVRVDGHTVIAPDYVRACVSALERTDADNVGGRMDAIGESGWGQAIALATSSPFGVGGARFHYSTHEEWVDTVYMGAWRAEVFTRIGLFDESLVRNQDDEFNYRLRAAGGKILLTPTIQSRYYNRSSLRSLWRQYYQYGYYKVRVMQLHPRQMSARQFAPPLFVAGLVGGALLAPFSRTLRRLYGGALALYGVAALGASVLTAYRHGWRHLPALPIVFGTLHVSYGLGFLAGLLRFNLRHG